MNPINLTVIDDFLTSDECDSLISLKLPELEPSSVVCHETHQSVLSDHRTSSGCFFKKHETPLIQTISYRVAWLTRTQSNQQEGFQFLRYEKTEQYKPHHDFFQDSNRSALDRGGNRIKTAVIYLNTPELGGETYFPHLNLLQKAKKGTLVAWNNLDDKGNKIEESFHAGMPVLQGQKFCMPIWIRQGVFK